jgi:formylglycine-generating enzyme required for sulfatase activity
LKKTPTRHHLCSNRPIYPVFKTPLANGGAGGYWLYPTRSNIAPDNVVGDGTNEANCIVNAKFCERGRSATDGSHLTPVGAFLNSHSYYATFDQGGDVSQWNDAIFQEKGRISPGELRGGRGGCANAFAQSLQSSARGAGGPSDKVGLVGFRVATLAQPISGQR